MGATGPTRPERRPLPRPADNRPGEPAPWIAMPVDRRTGLTLDRVRDRLDRGRGPSGEGTSDGIPEQWRAWLAEGGPPRRAAVLVPLFEESGEARVILTVRSDRMRSHRGEVAFPGGRIELGESLADAALREAHEEIGLSPHLATVIGELTSTPTVSSESVMTPVVATLEGRPALRANPDEVERIFDVALRDLVADGVFHEEVWVVPGRAGSSGRPGAAFPVWFFDVAGETVWGATARALIELLCVTLEAPLPRSLVAR